MLNSVDSPSRWCSYDGCVFLPAAQGTLSELAVGRESLRLPAPPSSSLPTVPSSTPTVSSA